MVCVFLSNTKPEWCACRQSPHASLLYKLTMVLRAAEQTALSQSTICPGMRDSVR